MKIKLQSCAAQRANNVAVWASIPIRLVVGYGFIEHGYSKIVGGPGQFAARLNGLGIPFPELASWSTIVVELICGSAILTGALVPAAAMPLFMIMLTAMIYVHLPFGFSSIKLVAVNAQGVQFGPPGIEVNLLYITCLATLLLIGPGEYSVDGWITNRRTKGSRS